MLESEDSAALTGLVAGSVASMVVLAALGRFVERVDRRRLAAIGGLLSAVSIFPAFLLLIAYPSVGLVLGLFIGLSLLMVQYAVIAALLADQFPVEMRYSGIPLCFQLSAVLRGGALPILASGLVREAGGTYVPAAALMVAAGLITVVGAAACRPSGATGNP